MGVVPFQWLPLGVWFTVMDPGLIPSPAMAQPESICHNCSRDQWWLLSEPVCVHQCTFVSQVQTPEHGHHTAFGAQHICGYVVVTANKIVDLADVTHDCSQCVITLRFDMQICFSLLHFLNTFFPVSNSGPSTGASSYPFCKLFIYMNWPVTFGS